MNPIDNQLPIEVFQPEVNGQIKKTTLDELKKWVVEGKLQPNHKLRIKDLSWIEARKIPALQNLFEEKNNSSTHPPTTLLSSTSPTFSTSSPANFVKSSRSTRILEINRTKTTDSQPVSVTKPVSAADLSLKFTSPKVHSLTVGKIDDTKVLQQTTAGSESTQNSTEKIESIGKIETADKKEITNEVKASEITKSSLPANIEEVKSQAETLEQTKVEAPQKNEFKTIEKPKRAESSKIEPPVKLAESSPDAQKKSVNLKSIAGFLGGCLLMFLLAYGGSYLWVYQIKGPVEVDEKNFTELSNLEDKLTSDKIEVRLKAAEKEKSLKQSGDKSATGIQLSDVSQEIAELEKNHNVRRQNIIENYRTNMQDSDFNVTFPFSFVTLLFAFLMARVFYGKSALASEGKSLTAAAAASQTKSVLKNEAKESEKTNREDTLIEIEKQIEKTPSGTSVEATVEQSGKESKIVKESGENQTASTDGEARPAAYCLLHRETAAKFFCDKCSNNFCEECPQTIEEKENCCMFCRTTCKPLAVQKAESGAEPEEKKKPSLLDLGKDSTFVIYDYPDERTRKLGVIPAFFIALLLSGSLAVFWVYKITPYLENRGKEVVQNTQTQNQKPAKSGVANAFEQSGFNDQSNTNSGKQANANSGSQADGDSAESNTAGSLPNNTAASQIDENLCIDPESKREFKCSDEPNPELRRALHEHAVQVKSVEKARADIKEKTTLILSLVSPTAREELRKAREAKTPPDPLAAARAEKEKQQFIRVFAISFCVMFGLLFATRFFSKK